MCHSTSSKARSGGSTLYFKKTTNIQRTRPLPKRRSSSFPSLLHPPTLFSGMRFQRQPRTHPLPNRPVIFPHPTLSSSHQVLSLLTSRTPVTLLSTRINIPQPHPRQLLLVRPTPRTVPLHQPPLHPRIAATEISVEPDAHVGSGYALG
jgi:hypothetical protein